MNGETKNAIAGTASKGAAETGRSRRWRREDPVAFDLEQEELKGFSRSLAELEWLLLILVLLYFTVQDRPLPENGAALVSMVLFAMFILAFRYLNLWRHQRRLKLITETWVMLCFITWTIWQTGRINSPLDELYLLVIIASALTLGKFITMLQLACIILGYLVMGFVEHSGAILAPATVSDIMSRFAPFLLVAYLTTILAADIEYAKRKVRLLSQSDDLTMLLNMRTFNTLLEREIRRSERHAQVFSVMMIDIDGLKKINDSHGHTTGTRVIKSVAQAIRDRVRTSDVVARYGGDEFVVLLTRTGSRLARQVAERILTAVSHTSFDLRGQAVSASISIGIATFPHSGNSIYDIVDKADAALYKSKKTGRNTVCVYTEEPAGTQQALAKSA
jgi:diguanylate cyclase (GGDEF)-like protein